MTMLILELVQLVLLLGALIVTVKSFRYVRNWNRDKATVDALNEDRIVDTRLFLDNAIGLSDTKKPICVRRIREPIAEDGEVKKHIVLLLRHSRSLARGVDAKVYDEAIFRQDRGRLLVWDYARLSAYIESVRVDHDWPQYYEKFEGFARRYAREVYSIKLPPPARSSSGGCAAGR